MAARRARLTDAGVARLRPAAREYTVWDTRIAGLGVRVRPSGHRSFVCYGAGPGGPRRIALGPACSMDVETARRRRAGIEAEAAARPEAPGRGGAPTFAAFVAGAWRADRARCKSSTLRGMDSALRSQLLPAFGATPLDRIAPADVERWFARHSRTAPGGANHALGILRRILNRAVALGLVGKNPARGLRRNPRPKLARFLSREEIRRLRRALDALVAERPSRRAQADIIRLLLLTGCRRGEIVGLRWQEVDGDTLRLADAKTGPRAVFLAAEARAILDDRPRTGSAFAFPSPLDPSKPRYRELPLWYEARRRAGVEDCRLHDLRHTFASQAALAGVPLPVVARLLGHKHPRMTLRYAHVGDRETEAAAERIGAAIAAALDGGAREAPRAGGAPASVAPRP